MEFLKVIKKRSFINEVIYIALNIAMAVSLMLIIRFTGSIWLAFILVLIGKWRIFAVRFRYWFAHIQANLVNIIVSVSYVCFLYLVNIADIPATQSLTLQLILVLIDVVWLVFLKPQSKRIYVVAQAAVGLYVGTSALFALSYSWIASPVVLLSWLIGYASARHILSSYDEESHTELLSLVWAFVVAEISWLAFHWTVAYRIPGLSGFLLPQVALILLCLGFLAYKAYDSYYHHQKIRYSEIVLPLAFTVGIITVLLVLFNGVSANIV